MYALCPKTPKQWTHRCSRGCWRAALGTRHLEAWYPPRMQPNPTIQFQQANSQEAAGFTMAPKNWLHFTELIRANPCRKKNKKETSTWTQHRFLHWIKINQTEIRFGFFSGLIQKQNKVIDPFIEIIKKKKRKKSQEMANNKNKTC